MSTQEQIEALIVQLLAIRSRPTLYIGPLHQDFINLSSLITGIRIACNTFGVEFDESTYIQAASDRGWNFKSIYPDARLIYEQLDRDVARTVDEVLLIEICAWQKLSGQSIS